MSARALACVLAALLTGCAVGPNFKRPAPPPAADYGSAPSHGETASAPGTGGDSQHFVSGMNIPAQWWTLFQSPALTRLVEQALKANPDVHAAEAALRQAHELYLAQRTSFFPVVAGTAGVSRAENPAITLANPTVSPNSTYTLYTSQLTLSYLPDVFGSTRRTVEAARAQAESTRFQLEAAYLSLSSNVVVTVLQEASLRGQIEATERLVQLQHQITAAVQRQRTLGTASDLDLLAQQSAEAQVSATLPPLQKQLGQARDALTALLGRFPSEEPVETFSLTDL
ncbi:MAG TPA: efflux transporter outer membrane subunit, partial [Steroidobacteraceae bacterium]